LSTEAEGAQQGCGNDDTQQQMQCPSAAAIDGARADAQGTTVRHATTARNREDQHQQPSLVLHLNAFRSGVASEHTTPLLRQLHWLHVPQRTQF